MCGIITLHILGHGGVLDSCDFNSAGYWSSWWIEICAYCSVDLFALLSGWLGIYKKKHSVFRAAELLAVVFCPIHRLNPNILKQTFPYIHNIFILPTLPDSCLILYSHTQQTTFPSHSDYDLHDIHQKHCNKQSDL